MISRFANAAMLAVAVAGMVSQVPAHAKGRANAKVGWTGYYIQNGYIWGPKMGARYYVIADHIWGPGAKGEYYIINNYIWGPIRGGEYRIQDGYIYGPAGDPPWMRTTAAK